MPLTHYQVLDLTPSATADEVRRAYKREALSWHPDRRMDDPKAHRRFIAIRAAYDVLSDPARRASYDAVLQQREAAARQQQPRQEAPWERPPYTPPPRYPPPPTPGPSRRTEPQKRGVPTWLVIMLLFWLLRFLSTKSCDSGFQTGWRETSPRSGPAVAVAVVRSASMQ